MKQSESRALVHGLAGLLAARIASPAPLMIPVPLHWRRRLWRGYNQSSMLAHAIQYHQGEEVKVADNLVIRHQATPSQQGLSRAQRQRNLRHAFQLKGSPAPAHVAIVDDVVTTGSTVQQICQLLLETGVECIDIYCLCRTPAT
jgi:ComF family protein